MPFAPDDLNALAQLLLAAAALVAAFRKGPREPGPD